MSLARAALAAVFLLFPFFSTPAHAAAKTCQTAYEDAAENYWIIISDMIRFKALFDNYDSLCRHYYPGVIKKLQPDANHLRDQVARDMKNVNPAMTYIFNTNLTAIVPKRCAGDKKARNIIRRAFLSGIHKRLTAMETRMRKSGKTLRDPKTDLKLCRDLPGLVPMIKEKLGPDLSNPLLTMSLMNRTYMVRDGHKLQDSFATYKKALQVLQEKHPRKRAPAPARKPARKAP